MKAQIFKHVHRFPTCTLCHFKTHAFDKPVVTENQPVKKISGKKAKTSPVETQARQKNALQLALAALRHKPPTVSQFSHVHQAPTAARQSQAHGTWNPDLYNDCELRRVLNELDNHSNISPDEINRIVNSLDRLVPTSSETHETTSTSPSQSTPIANADENQNLFENKQMLFASVLKEFDQALSIEKSGNVNAIPYFLASGTALGALRDNAFIDHDQDIDIGIFHRDVRELPMGAVNILEPLLRSSFTLFDVLGEMEHGLELRFRHNSGVLLDINLFHHENDSIWWATYYGEAEKRKYKKYRYKHRLFVPELVPFAGHRYHVAPISFLEEHYGKDWRVPKKFDYWAGLRGEYHNIIEE